MKDEPTTHLVIEKSCNKERKGVGREGGREGRKEGRKEGRTEGRKKGRKKERQKERKKERKNKDRQKVTDTQKRTQYCDHDPVRVRVVKKKTFSGCTGVHGGSLARLMRLTCTGL
jgi:hypothetical protein